MALEGIDGVYRVGEGPPARSREEGREPGRITKIPRPMVASRTQRVPIQRASALKSVFAEELGREHAEVGERRGGRGGGDAGCGHGGSALQVRCDFRVQDRANETADPQTLCLHDRKVAVSAGAERVETRIAVGHFGYGQGVTIGQTVERIADGVAFWAVGFCIQGNLQM